MANKKIDGFYIYADTPVKTFKVGQAYGVAFDVKKKEMLGFLIADHMVAKAVGNYFIQMSKALKQKSPTPEGIKEDGDA